MKRLTEQSASKPRHKHQSTRDLGQALYSPLLNAALITMLCNLRLELIEEFDIHSLGMIFKPYTITQVFVFIAAALVMYVDERTEQEYRRSVPVHVLAVLYAFFMVEGRYFFTENAIDLFTPRPLYLLFSCLALFGYYLFLRPAISILFSWFDMVVAGAAAGRFASVSRVVTHMEEHPFATSTIILAVFLVPVTLISYPGLFMGDTKTQLAVGFNAPSWKFYMPLINESIKLNNHHPITHTMLMHVCVVLGKNLFGSYNMGIFLAVCIQTIALILSLANLTRVMVRCCKVPPALAVVAVIMMGVNPRMQTYLVLLSKDALYTSFFLTFLATLVELSLSEKRPHMLVLLGISALGTILFRNDGIYTVGPTLLAFLVIKPARKTALVALPLVVCFFVVWNSVILPGLSVTKGSRREMLSVPFQQTARYVQTYGDEVTEEERQAIDAVLDYDHLAELYDPNVADPVKATFKNEATKDELSAYFKTWARMFLKHPATYFHATLNNLSQYYYPDTTYENGFNYEWGEESMVLANKWCVDVGTDFHFPASLIPVHTAYEAIREFVFNLPLIGCVTLSATYVWLVLLVVAYHLFKRSKLGCALSVPFLMQLLILSAGPTNGAYFRYAFPLMVCLPLLASVALVKAPLREADTAPV